MKKIIRFPAVLIFIIIVIISGAPAALALPSVLEYKNASFDVKQLNIVLVMPVKTPAALAWLPLSEKIRLKWGELINTKRNGSGSALLTEDQLLQKHRRAPVKWTSSLQRTSYVNGIAEKYADAVLTMTITVCDYGSVNHPQRFAQGDEYEEIKDWDENGRIVMRKELVRERTLRQAWTERYAEAACRAELWSLKKGTQTLVYSCAASDRASSAVYGNKLPPLEKVVSDLMEHVMKRVPLK